MLDFEVGLELLTAVEDAVAAVFVLAVAMDSALGV